VTVSLLTTHFADFTGHLPADPRVALVNAEGRSFLRGDAHQWDLIWFVAPDSYAAMNAATSGAFVLSESYLYTVEMVVESLARLRPQGVLCMQFGEIDFDRRPNRTVRYLATAREALRRVGIADFARHVLVSSSPAFGSLSTLLVAKEPFSPGRVEEFVRQTARIPGGIVRHAPGVAAEDGLVTTVVASPPEVVAERSRAYPYDVGPVTDDSPFFWHFTSFRRAVSRAVRGEAALSIRARRASASSSPSSSA
jgi:predicted membrane-bound spermidine synthase